ncbi:hypothetical protein [Isorropodon fossajaponicum symbiont]|uniref:hypothetical protein n=1 Tax=Isorropodon fossajaponicum symbiont TaxID=883811 RepID=UPI001FD9C87B|nr:hypothetical protein [Isorropodon fossajaponicum symbiont]
MALSLLFQGYVHELHLNDIDKSIWSFWNAIVNNTDKFVSTIENTPIAMEEWHKQKDIQKNSKRVSNFDLGFSTFF